MSQTLGASCLIGLCVFASTPTRGQEGAAKKLVATEREALLRSAEELDGEGVRLYAAGQHAEGVKRFESALSIRRKAYPASEFPDGHFELANNISLVAFVLRAQRRYDRALALAEEGLEAFRKLVMAKQFPDGHPRLAFALHNLANVHHDMGRPDKATPLYQEALAMRRRLFPPKQFPDGHEDLSATMNNLALVLQEIGSPEKALPLFTEALSINRRLFPASKFPHGDPQLAASISHMGLVLNELEEPARALPYLEEVLSMRRQLLARAKKPDSIDYLAKSLQDLGWTLAKVGRHADAEKLLMEALEIRRRQYPENAFPTGHPALSTCLNNLGLAYQESGAHDRSLESFRQALDMNRRLYPASKFPRGETNLASTIHNVGSALFHMGRFDECIPWYEESLAMRRNLHPRQEFPSGHRELASALSEMGAAYDSVGRADRALDFFEEELAMQRTLYPAAEFPNGHVKIANSLNYIGVVYRRLRNLDKALRCTDEALSMYQRLYPANRYPDGHPKISRSLSQKGGILGLLARDEEALALYEQALATNRRLSRGKDELLDRHNISVGLHNVGSALSSLNRFEDAIPYLKEALDIQRGCYPEQSYPAGHLNLVNCLRRLAYTQASRGQLDEALTNFREALAMQLRLMRKQALYAPEADALALAQSLATCRDSCMSLAGKADDGGAGAYQFVWSTKAAVTRVLEMRRLATRAALADPAASAKVRSRWADLASVRQRIDSLLNGNDSTPSRDRHLTEWTDRRESLERELAVLLPEPAQVLELDRMTPTDLQKSLPQRAAFVDYVRCQPFEPDPQRRRDMGAQPAHYAAFVIAPGQRAVRVELGPAPPIDDALKTWRREIAERKPNESPAKLRQLIWAPLEKHLPVGTEALYLSPDGELARLPFAALPGRTPGTILLEDFAIAFVPHGPFLFQHLKQVKRQDEARPRVLAMGGLNYDLPQTPNPRGRWPYLKGTTNEVQQVAAIGRGNTDVLSLTGQMADVIRLTRELPRVRYAHLASHGYFAEADLNEEERKYQQYQERMQGSGLNGDRIGAGKRSPLGFVGLVLSRANDPAAAAAAEGAISGALAAALQPNPILTGERIADLPLDNLRLVTLSACETGLGDLTGGEGVQGLQRAFHLAGCENVVCSLWQVNDEATTALMRRFYHHLWEKKEPPIQALRLAQLEVYRNPTQVADLVRGNAPKFSGATKSLPKEAAPKDGERAATKLWAAFVLSGVGR